MKTIIFLTILSYLITIAFIIGISYLLKSLDFTLYETMVIIILLGIYVKVSE